MKKILSIILHDFRKVTSSVVAIVVIVALCIIPCLYSWFNILSNWDPYEPEATGNIPIAVVNEDEGTDLLGLRINIGEKVKAALEGNDMIGWTFPDSKEEAVEGVYAGDYYAALIVPPDFSTDTLSMISDELENPELEYYENEKKNAVAATITDKAKGALQNEINKTVIEVIAKYVTEAASAAQSAGLDPADMFGDLGNTMSDLSEKLDYGTAIAEAAAGLTKSADSLLKVSDDLIGSAQNTLSEGDKLLGSAKDSLPEISSGQSVAETVREEADMISSDVKKLKSELSNVRNDMKAYNKYVDKKLGARKKLIEEIRSTAGRISRNLSKLGLTKLSGLFGGIRDKLSDVLDKLGKLKTATKSTWSETQNTIDSITGDLASARKKAKTALDNAKGDLDSKIKKAAGDVRKVVSETRKTLTDAYGGLDTLSGTLSGYEKTLSDLEKGINETNASILSMQQGLQTLSGLFTKLSESDALKDINHLISDGSDVIAEHLASPVRMDKEEIYPVSNNGSAMASFYTVLAQWIGAVLAAVLIRVSIKRKKQFGDLKLHERFFGRYRLFLTVGLIQALIVSLGDLLYVGIQCLHPVKFVLASCITGIVFSMIIYALVFALDNLGLALGVIILIVQVAGSGGLFPVEVLPEPFAAMYPFMPFRYAMDAMRECVAGTYGNTYITCLGILGLFFVGAAIFGLLLHYPALRINKMIEESKSKSDIML